MRKAIVTGASGFIGSWLAQELLENDYQVTVLVRDKLKLLPEIREHCLIVEKSLSDVKPKDFSTCDIFFHLAWSGVAPKEKHKLCIQLDNIRGSLNALEASNQAGCTLFVAVGTVAEYALCDNVMDMNARQTPNDFYGAAKVASHYFMEVRARQLKQSFIWCVVPSTFGERRIDDNIITYTIKTLLRGDKPIYGDLAQMWDFLYVKDTVKALRLIGEKGTSNKVYGIGSGGYKTLREYISCIRDVIDPELPLGIGENKDEVVRTFSSCVNNYDLKKDTGFQPEYTFEDGIRRTVDYFKRGRSVFKEIEEWRTIQ